MLHLARSLNTSLSRCLMAGLACGILAAIMNAGYVYLYGKITGFSDGLFDPLLIFFGFPLLLLLGGLVLFEMMEFVKKGRLFFTILALLLTATAVVLALSFYGKEMEGLLIGIILITGLLAGLLLPYLATHAKIFMDDEELSESSDS